MLLNAITIGTSQPRELADFYARLLGGEVVVACADWAEVRVPGGFTLNLERERHFRRPVWPAAAGEQTASQHLDIEVGDLDVAMGLAVACGAVPAEVQPQDDVRVLFDPDGHPFCLFVR
jgi:hypothetical protein